MAKEQEEFQKQVQALVEAAMFENWLRFYFIKEEGDDLKIELPPKSVERIKELYPHLLPLAEALNGRKVDFETSRDAVLKHAMAHIDGKLWPAGTVQRTLQSSTFQTALQLFHIWEQAHEEQLDEGFREFGAWRSLFSQWLATPGARELEKKLLGQGG